MHAGPRTSCTGSKKLASLCWLRNTLLLLVGYGPLLCVISFTALATVWRRNNLQWEKTVKSGNARILK